MIKYLVVGDIHGCLQEFMKLLDVVNFWKQPRQIISVGDIVDKHDEPDNYKELMEFFRDWNAKTVLANHEEKHLRFHRHELKKEKTGKPNPMSPAKDPEKHEDFWKTRKALLSLKWDVFRFMDKFNTYHYLPEHNICVVHGGLEKDVRPEHMHPKAICRVRRLKKNGRMASLSEATNNMPFWDEVYDGHSGMILYGHAPVKEPRVKEHSVGLDTGAVFGNTLSCFLIPEFEIVQVKSKRVYCENKLGWLE